MKTYGGVEVYVHHSSPRTRWRRVVSFMPRPLSSQGNSLRYPSDRRLDGPTAGLDVKKEK
jgi:hypothetical protein